MIKFIINCWAFAFIMAILGIFFFPLWILAALALVTPLFYPLFKVAMGDKMKEKGY